jgi:hypothetical protein
MIPIHKSFLPLDIGIEFLDSPARSASKGSLVARRAFNPVRAAPNGATFIRHKTNGSRLFSPSTTVTLMPDVSTSEYFFET